MEVCSRPLCRRYYAPILSIASFVRYGLLGAAAAGVILLVLEGTPPPPRPVYATLAFADRPQRPAAAAAVLLEGTVSPPLGAAGPTTVAAWAWASAPEHAASMLAGAQPGVGRAAANNWSVVPVFSFDGSGGNSNGSGNGSGVAPPRRAGGSRPVALHFEATLTPLDDAEGNASAALAAAVLSAKVVVRLSLEAHVGASPSSSSSSSSSPSLSWPLVAVAMTSASSPLPGRGLWADGELRLERLQAGGGGGGELFALAAPGRSRRQRLEEQRRRRLTRYQRRAAEFWRAIAGLELEGEEEPEREAEEEEEQEEDEKEAAQPLPPLFPAAELAAAGDASSASSAFGLLAAAGDPALPAAMAAAAGSNSNSDSSGLRASFSPPLVSWIAVPPGNPWRPPRTSPSSPSSSSTPPAAVFRVALTVRLPSQPLLLLAPPSRADALLWAWARLWAAWAALGGVAGWFGAWAVRRGRLWAAYSADAPLAGPAWRF